MNSNLLKQKKIPKLGVLFNTLYITLPVLSIFGYIGICLTTYATFITDYMPWLSLPIYLVAVILSALFIMFLFWKFVYLGYFNNPIGQDVEKIKEKLGIKD